WGCLFGGWLGWWLVVGFVVVWGVLCVVGGVFGGCVVGFCVFVFGCFFFFVLVFVGVFFLFWVGFW
ncbi:hypothetical protein RA269_28020, partial [Pseudomonas syringae pv. tagetis]|uniref:hypothetical protein n=1 Tax=Pseudomonas syringae group genomosp. 7 TaxID=251699 RepID=UPI003770073D